jgi:hypothetical protein
VTHTRHLNDVTRLLEDPAVDGANDLLAAMHELADDEDHNLRAYTDVLGYGARVARASTYVRGEGDIGHLVDGKWCQLGVTTLLSSILWLISAHLQ